MPRLVYRRVGGRESIVAVHSVNTAAGGGGVRWYEFRIDGKRDVYAVSAGHVRAGRLFRWMASPAIDRVRQHRHRLLVRRRAALRRASGSPAGSPSDPPGQLTLHETVLVEGEARAKRDALGGLHADRRRSERRLHDLVRRRLPQEGRGDATRAASARSACRAAATDRDFR